MVIRSIAALSLLTIAVLPTGCLNSEPSPSASSVAADPSVASAAAPAAGSTTASSTGAVGATSGANSGSTTSADSTSSATPPASLVVEMSDAPDFVSLMKQAQTDCQTKDNRFVEVENVQARETLWANLQTTFSLESDEIANHLYDSTCGTSPIFCGCVRTAGYDQFIAALNKYSTCAENHTEEANLAALQQSYFKPDATAAIIGSEFAQTGGSQNLCFAADYSSDQVKTWIGQIEQTYQANLTTCKQPAKGDAALCNKLTASYKASRGFSKWMNDATSTFKNPGMVSGLLDSLKQNLVVERTRVTQLPYPISCDGEPDLSMSF